MNDLLAELRAEREKHRQVKDFCRQCGADLPWPCPLSRALDCAIALLFGAQEFKRQADCCGWNYNYGDLASVAAETLLAAERAYHGEGEHGEK